ncbi:hypothetical protein Enr13x_23770 [Stieleria neptunia]|uniref:Uncharacterized protein n=1 Tax=Stieleria neptunia TaxID=2527979 RepID=A0A518HNW8_9BACT|nr:hypothetical protein Enr13x_23770 [Stieleria neptunia]
MRIRLFNLASAKKSQSTAESTKSREHNEILLRKLLEFADYLDAELDQASQRLEALLDERREERLLVPTVHFIEILSMFSSRDEILTQLLTLIDLQSPKAAAEFRKRSSAISKSNLMQERVQKEFWSVRSQSGIHTMHP